MVRRKKKTRIDGGVDGIVGSVWLIKGYLR